MSLKSKQAALKAIISRTDRVVVAFSGGVDSSFLSYMSHLVLGSGALAVTLDTPFIPRKEIETARRVAGEIGISHQVVSFSLNDDSVLRNPENRCYLCKTVIFGEIRKVARQKGIDTIFDGSNIDDLSDYRPGLKAIKELSIVSPLLEAGFGKEDIRAASREAGLSTWDLPSLACMASRIPYGQTITTNLLRQIEQAEDFLRENGIRQLRVRVQGNSARIEVAPGERSKFFDLDFMNRVSQTLKDIGFSYVSLDLEGYRTGKLNAFPVQSSKEPVAGSA